MGDISAFFDDLTDEEVLPLHFRKYPKIVMVSAIYDLIYDRWRKPADSPLDKEAITAGFS